MSEPFVVLDPTDERTPAARQPAPRLANLAGQTVLAGKTIGLVDISKARGDVFLERLAGRLAERGARIERFRKPTFARAAPVDLRQEIAERCDAVIVALAD